MNQDQTIEQIQTSLNNSSLLIVRLQSALEGNMTDVERQRIQQQLDNARATSATLLPILQVLQARQQLQEQRRREGQGLQEQKRREGQGLQEQRRQDEEQRQIRNSLINPPDLVAMADKKLDQLDNLNDAESLLKSITDCTKTVQLPFLSLQPQHKGRLIQNINEVTYYGREALAQVKSRLDADESDMRNFMIYGTIGSGKTHILLALACYYFIKGDNVVYFSKANQFYDWNHWRFALILLKRRELRKPVENQDIEFISKLDVMLEKSYTLSFEDFLQGIQLKFRADFVFFIDQWDVLDDTKTKTLRKFLSIFELRRHLASSSNDNIVKELFRKDNAFPTKFIDIYNGLTDNEFKVWLANNEKSLPKDLEEHKNDFIDKTGKVPLFLHEFATLEQEDYQSRIKCLKESYFDIQVTLEDFYESRKSCKESIQYGRMCYNDRPLDRYARDFICHEYFFFRTPVSINQVDRCASSGIARYYLREVFRLKLKLHDVDFDGAVEMLKKENEAKGLGIRLRSCGRNQILTFGLESCGIYRIDEERCINNYYGMTYPSERVIYHTPTDCFEAIDALIVAPNRIIGVYFTKIRDHRRLFENFCKNLAALGIQKDTKITFCWMVTEGYEGAKPFRYTSYTSRIHHITIDIVIEKFHKKVQEALDKKKTLREALKKFCFVREEMEDEVLDEDKTLIAESDSTQEIEIEKKDARTSMQLQHRKRTVEDAIASRAAKKGRHTGPAETDEKGKKRELDDQSSDVAPKKQKSTGRKK